MKKLMFFVVFIATTLAHHTFAQDTSSNKRLYDLLTSYYTIKNALVAEKATVASSEAVNFVKALNHLDGKTPDQPTFAALRQDADRLSQTKDIKQQREEFASLSTNMYKLAKSVKLSSEPVYYAYCPMKKAYWLSSGKAIKNPYFGNAMLTCGSVKETF